MSARPAGKAGKMLIIAIAVGAFVVATPLIAAALVTFASLREDAKRSLGGRPPGWLEATVRRLLGSVSTVRQPPAPRPRLYRAGPRDLPGDIPRPRLAADDQPADSTLTLPRS